MAERADRFRARALAAILTAALLAGGCATIGYYTQSVGGHLHLMSLRKPVNQIIADERTSDELRTRLHKAAAIREFAHRELDLPDNDSYRSYVELDRPYVSWTVIAAPELSLEPKTWCFLVVGCVAYRGYFKEEDAVRFAAGLEEQGYDVVVSGVQAYSTLGWFDDPLLNTMIRLPDYRLAGLIFHELAHQRLYVKDDSSFNEAYAVVIERAGVRRWLESEGNADFSARQAADERRRAQFLELIGRARESLQRVYSTEFPDADKRARKAAVFSRMRDEYRELRQSWGGYSGYDHWFESGLNNAKLALVATYNANVPALERLLQEKGGDLAAFNAACEALARMSTEERKLALERLSQSTSG